MGPGLRGSWYLRYSEVVERAQRHTKVLSEGARASTRGPGEQGRERSGPMFRDSGFEFEGLEFGAEGSGSRTLEGVQVLGLGCVFQRRVSRSRVWGSDFEIRASGFGFRVSD